MKRSVHMFIGASLGLASSIDTPLLTLYLIVLGWLGGYIPDLDLRHGHRKFLHNIWVLGAAIAVGSIVIGLIYKEYPLTPYSEEVFIFKTIIVFGGSWLLHILCDSLTIKGVYILYPISNHRFRIASFKSNDVVVNIIGILIGALFILYWIDEVLGINILPL